MKLAYLYSLFITILFLSCDNANSSKIEKTLPQEAKGGRSYGGVFRLSEAENIKSLYPPNITDAFSYRVSTLVYEGLFKFDPDSLHIINSLIESYNVDESGKTYTFKLKKGVKFHDDISFPGKQGRELVANDVKYCFTQLCTQSSSNQHFSIFKDVLKGANIYFKASANGKQPDFDVEGIKIIDDYTIQLVLEKPSSILLYNLARPATFIYPKEAVDKYGVDMRIKTVGTGPFQLTDVDEGIAMIFKKNPHYHSSDRFGNRLPFLDAVSIQFIRDKKN